MASAEACYEWTRDYVKERKAFGGNLTKLQTIRHRLAHMKVSPLLTTTRGTGLGPGRWLPGAAWEAAVRLSPLCPALICAWRLQTDIVVARAFVDQCLRLHQEGRLDNEMASMAKAWGSDLQCRIADEGLQVSCKPGGAGNGADSPP